LPRRFGYNPLTDIQVLAPMNRGQVGVGHLNPVLQQHLNPPHPGKAEFGHGHRVLRVGDKVIQKINNYRLEVFNGDLGIIERIELEDRRPTSVDARASSVITVRFSDRLVCYDYADVLELGHGFCVSIHKAQGSEYPAVVIPLHMQHFMLLSRNLLYTALTRAKELVVMIGTTRAIGAAMHNLEAVHRFTGLVRELKG
jgi:exodeoxyribonuclease V alpha subunit